MGDCAVLGIGIVFVLIFGKTEVSVNWIEEEEEEER